jgi:hypothetical protein
VLKNHEGPPPQARCCASHRERALASLERGLHTRADDVDDEEAPTRSDQSGRVVSDEVPDAHGPELTRFREDSPNISFLTLHG